MRRRASKSPEYAAAREVVLARSGGHCEACGARVTLESMHAHHRAARSGGRNDSPANLLGLCRRDHERVHSRPTMSRELGQIIPSWSTADPGEVPVELRDGCWLLGDDGRRFPYHRDKAVTGEG